MFPVLPIVLVADDPLVRGGLAALLPEDVPIVRAVGTDADLAAVVAGSGAHVVLWDASEGLPTVDPGVPVVVLVSAPAEGARAVASGVAGVLLRDALERRLTAALVAARAGLRCVDERISASLRTSAAPLDEAPRDALTGREVEVLELLAEGRSNREIALALDISPHTAKFHVDRLLQKLDASSRTDAVVRAARLGLLSL